MHKIATGQSGEHTSGCWLDYGFSKKYNKVLAKSLNKQQALDIGLTAIQQIKFTRNLDKAGNSKMYFHYFKINPFYMFYEEPWRYC